MKLNTKIQLSFCVTFIVLLFGVASIVAQNSYKSNLQTVDDSIGTAAVLASSQIDGKFDDYMDVVTLVGNSETLYGKHTIDEKKEYLDGYVEEFGFTSANVLDKNGVSLIDGTEFGDRDYVKKALNGEVNVSDITLSKLTGAYGVSIAAPIVNDAGSVSGVVYFRLDTDFILDVIKSIKISDNSYAYLVDADGNIITHPNEEMILNYNICEGDTRIGSIADTIISGKAGNGSYELNGKEMLCGFSPIDCSNGWSIVIAAPENDFNEGLRKVTQTVLVMGVIAVIIVIIISGFIARMICTPVNIVKDALTEIAKGNLKVEIPESNRKDEVAILQNTARELTETLSSVIGQVNSVLESMADCDLRTSEVSHFPGEFDSLSISVNSIRITLTKLIAEIQNAVMNVDTGSRELAQATQALSQGTLSQANSIQALASNLDSVVEVIERNSNQGEIVNGKLGNLDNQIQNMNGQMEALKDAVNEIETMSSSIQKIVGTIDGIAFQTNILSLNASVEAARAGDMGSGFAVVAEEVRNLAIQCSESSNKTADLVQKCIKAISNAKKCSDETSDSLSIIVKDSNEIAHAFEQISADTVDQAEKSKRIKAEVNNISDVVQTNTATAEETAASTAVLSEQAANLEDMIRVFKR